MTMEKELIDNIKRGHKHLEEGFLGNTSRNTKACCYTIQKSSLFEKFYTSFTDEEFIYKYPGHPRTGISDCEVLILQNLETKIRWFIIYSLELVDGHCIGERLFRENLNNGDVEMAGSGDLEYEGHDITDYSKLQKLLDRGDGRTDETDEELSELYCFLEKFIQND